MILHRVLLVLHVLPRLLIVSAYPSKLPCNFPAIFNFGDSNSDTGGLSATSLTDPVGWPNGETFFKMPSGRNADGRLLIDFIAEELGLPYVEPYLDALGGNFSHGANFATTLSPILDQNSTLPLGFYSPFSLSVQLSQFLQLKKRSQVLYQQGGTKKYMVPREEFFAEALYTIDIGQNDLTSILFSPNMSPENYLQDALQRLATVIKEIYKTGGRYFWIHNTGPLGCLPYVLVRPPVGSEEMDETGCRIFYNALAEKYNAMLNETVVKLREELPAASLTLVDVYSAKYHLITHASNYGKIHLFYIVTL
ncbi:GDSL esterase/lipase [Rhynchospora pubera]|uniref:GDSL esterase/lipase n=1 Tax=Rhynchospora pubera TaxID=906938 RepID=A0AAV8FHI4_9POAL|nr:GDSL esterase/lipase [Rhynchospora pubera]